MAKVLVTDTNLTNIANAIRSKNGLTTAYKPSEMASAITNIPSGGSSGASTYSLIKDETFATSSFTKVQFGDIDLSTHIIKFELNITVDGGDWLYCTVNKESSGSLWLGTSSTTNYQQTGSIINGYVYWGGKGEIIASSILKYIKFYPYTSSKTISGNIKVYSLPIVGL